MDAWARPVSKWELFEQDFRSSRDYDNPPQEVRLAVDFVSPTGHTNRVHGFWNGGNRWGVRFSPDQLGHWTFTTTCSDPLNSGLHGKSGKFLCTVQSLRDDLHRHGRIRVPKGSATFEYSDGTPFCWAADAVWEGARQSTRKEWADYVETRADQGFNVLLWRAAPGMDDRGKAAFGGVEEIEMDTAVLRRLDDKLNRLNQSGIVGAIAPFWEIGLADDELLPEDQVIVLLRQMVGRWDAHNVAWIIAFEADTNGRRAARWRRIGRNVFDNVQHSPVILFCGASHWALAEFAGEPWVDAVAYQSGNDVSEEARLWLALGPMTTLWTQQPTRPMLNLLPPEEAGLAADGQRIRTAQALECITRSLFVAPPAGLCYQSRATAEWDQTLDTNTVAITGEAMSEWQKSLFLPGASRIGQIRALLERSEFDRLLPASASMLIPTQSSQPAARPLSALATPRRERAVIFVPEGEVASLPVKAMRPGVEGTFFSVATGRTTPAEARKDAITMSFSAPGPGDWLLFLAPPND